MPVDQYVGGVEHAVGHLIYSRFFVKALRDLGLVDKNLNEPFTKLFNQGIVYKDGAKMSKSYGNIVTQDEISKKYGIDSARLFLMFVAAPDSQMEWTDKGIEGIFRFIRKIFSLYPSNKSDKKIEHYGNLFIKQITEDIENFRFNLAIIKLMQWSDRLMETCDRKSYENFLKVISIFAPHIAEELWHKLGNKSFISLEKWPVADDKKIDNEVEQKEHMIELVGKDINNIKGILKIDPPNKVEIYPIPKEVPIYQENVDVLKAISGSQIVSIYPINKFGENHPKENAKKAKPGKPAIYLE
jgi:leucyl-tRNA synthetase